MFYVEWLRVRNCLRILAIVFAVLFVFAIFGRVAAGVANEHVYRQIDHDMNARGAVVTKTQLSDGSMRTTIYDPSNGDHIVIVDRGWNGKEISISGPDIESHGSENVQIGSVGVHTIRSTQGGGTINISTDEPVSVRVLFLIAACVALVVGTILSGPLAKENGNHLEIAWTKPVSRERLAIGSFLVDVVGMIAAMVMTFVFLIVTTALFQLPRLAIDSQTWPVLALVILMPVAWYALLTALSASLKRGLGAVLGLTWLAALILPGLTLGLSQVENPLFHFIGLVLSYLTVLDPVVYLHLSSSSSPADVTPAYGYMSGVLSSPPLARAGICLALAVFYSALSLVQWRRLEA